MGQHPPGFITRSVSAGAGKGSDQEGFIHRLLCSVCSVLGEETTGKEENKNAIHSPHTLGGRAGLEVAL